jgi:hypothetical protein
MNFGYIGLFISLLILLGMLVWCHLSDYFKTNIILPKSDFINIAIPTGTPPLKYNDISYSNEQQKIPCNIMNQAQIPCNLIQDKIQDKISKCPKPTYDLSDSELAILYKAAYEKAGIEIMSRVLKDNSSATTTGPATNTTSSATTTRPATNTTSSATTTGQATNTTSSATTTRPATNTTSSVTTTRPATSTTSSVTTTRPAIL